MAVEVPSVETDKVLLLQIGQDPTTLFLEEFRLQVDAIEMESLLAALSSLVPDSRTADLLRSQFAIVDDDLFGYLARYAVPVAAHVRIDNKTKTVEPGALWYEETLPPDTLLYVTLSAWGSRNSESVRSSAQILADVKTGIFGNAPYLQVGGNETVGMGWCRITWLAGDQS